MDSVENRLENNRQPHNLRCPTEAHKEVYNIMWNQPWEIKQPTVQSCRAMGDSTQDFHGGKTTVAYQSAKSLERAAATEAVPNKHTCAAADSRAQQQATGGERVERSETYLANNYTNNSGKEVPINSRSRQQQLPDAQSVTRGDGSNLIASRPSAAYEAANVGSRTSPAESIKPETASHQTVVPSLSETRRSVLPTASELPGIESRSLKTMPDTRSAQSGAIPYVEPASIAYIERTSSPYAIPSTNRESGKTTYRKPEFEEQFHHRAVAAPSPANTEQSLRPYVEPPRKFEPTFLSRDAVGSEPYRYDHYAESNQPQGQLKSHVYDSQMQKGAPAQGQPELAAKLQTPQLPGADAGRVRVDTMASGSSNLSGSRAGIDVPPNGSGAADGSSGEKRTGRNADINMVGHKSGTESSPGSHPWINSGLEGSATRGNSGAEGNAIRGNSGAEGNATRGNAGGPGTSSVSDIPSKSADANTGRGGAGTGGGGGVGGHGGGDVVAESNKGTGSVRAGSDGGVGAGDRHGAAAVKVPDSVVGPGDRHGALSGKIPDSDVGAADRHSVASGKIPNGGSDIGNHHGITPARGSGGVISSDNRIDCSTVKSSDSGIASGGGVGTGAGRSEISGGRGSGFGINGHIDTGAVKASDPGLGNRQETGKVKSDSSGQWSQGDRLVVLPPGTMLDNHNKRNRRQGKSKRGETTNEESKRRTNGVGGVSTSGNAIGSISQGLRSNVKSHLPDQTEHIEITDDTKINRCFNSSLRQYYQQHKAPTNATKTGRLDMFLPGKPTELLPEEKDGSSTAVSEDTVCDTFNAGYGNFIGDKLRQLPLGKHQPCLDEQSDRYQYITRAGDTIELVATQQLGHPKFAELILEKNIAMRVDWKYILECGCFVGYLHSGMTIALPSQKEIGVFLENMIVDKELIVNSTNAKYAC